MNKQTIYKLVEASTLENMITTNIRQGLTISLLTYICYKQKTDVALTVHEACELLDMTPLQLAAAARQCLIRPIGQGSTAFFSAFDLVQLAVKLRRRHISTKLEKITSYADKTGE